MVPWTNMSQQLFLHSSPVCPTHRHIDTQTTLCAISVAIGRIWRIACRRCGLNRNCNVNDVLQMIMKFLYTYDGVVQRVYSLGERWIRTCGDLQVRPLCCVTVERQKTVEGGVQWDNVSVWTTCKSSPTDPRLLPTDCSLASVIRWNSRAVIFT